jgi:AcrR family transcriptional regulator
VTQPPVYKHKKPVQARANATVDTILEATAQILERGDPARFTTNHIAEHAGYSVGTLYSYFQNKESLLRTLALREIARQEGSLLAALADINADRSDAEIIRTVIHAALRPFGNRGQLRLAMMQQLMGDAEILAATDNAQKSVIDAFIALFSLRHQRPMVLDDNSRFTLIASVAGAMQRAVQERPDMFASPEFEDNIVALVKGLLNQAMRPR